MRDLLKSLCTDAFNEVLRSEELQRSGKFPKTLMMMSNQESLTVLVEEVGEVSKELHEMITDPNKSCDDLQIELIQVAAAALGWAERVKTKGK